MEVHEAVGAVVSTVTEEASTAAAGPALEEVSATEPAASRKTTVPAEQEETVTVIEEPEAAEGEKEQPVAVPAFEKSAEVRPVTDSEKVRVYAREAAPAGEEGVADQEAVGAVRSSVTEEAAAAVAGPPLPAESVTDVDAKLNTTVPAEQEEAVTVIDDPEAAEGVNTQPVAVPVLEKSAEVRPVTDSEKVRV